MKELNKEDLLSSNNAIEQIEQKQQEVELTFLGDLKPKNGHRLWEINKTTLEVSEAGYHKEERITYEEALKAFNNPQISTVKDVIVKPNHVYISALNAENALERYKNGKGSSHIPKSDISINHLE